MDIKESKEHNYATSIRHPWETARANVLNELICRHIPMEKNSSVIDLGCGDVFVTEFLAKKFPHVNFFAVDTALNNELIAIYKQKINLPNVFIHSSLSEISFEENKTVQLVLLSDVIEHIEDDIGFLSSLLQNKFIGPDTAFLITVPAFQSLFCSHDVLLGHYRRYTNSLLKKNLEMSGLKITRIGYFFLSLLLLRSLQTAKEKMCGTSSRKSTTDLVEWNGSPFLSKTLEKILWIDACISFLFGNLGITLPGLSNYAICKKLR
jgi:hypothetical protein